MRKRIKSLSEQYLYAFSIVWRSTKRWTILRLFLIFIKAVLPLASLYIMKLLIDKLTEEGAAIPNDLNEITYLILFLGLVLLLQALTTNVSQYINELQQQLVSDFMASEIQQQSLSVDLTFYEDPDYYDNHFMAQRHGLHKPTQLISSLMDFIQNTVSLIFIAGFIFLLHPFVALLLLVAVLPSAIIKYRFSQKLFVWEKKSISLEREAYYQNTILTESNYAKEVRVFNLGAYIKARFKEIRKTLFKERKGLNFLKMKVGTAGQVIEISAEVASYFFIAYRTLQGIITIGDLVIYFQAFQKGKSNLANALNSMVQLNDNRRFLAHVIDFLNIKPKLLDGENTHPFDEKIQKGIQLENISFRYPKSPILAVEDVSLNLKKGQITAFVGDNGSGKSTLIKLIARLYDPDSGNISIDNRNYKTIKLSDLRKKMSITFQDFAHYMFSVGENIQLGNLDIQDPLQIKNAAIRSGADQFISQLPDQYDQKLGKQFRDGTELSTGQWQKIALARMLFKEAEIIIVDEPTSAIDPLAEHQIFKELKKLAEDKIIILVTHRLYNLKIVDQIIVMSKGQIAEQGTHEDLISSDSLYRKMFETQQ